ncbi:serine-rich adhesin for platelets-like [Saccostrea cucullata]|uniref:serine-rich adhesin for platelets-like n=1 Tax=Saccostrea cuccullata TaxID=36930 RepID=UPI002ED4C7BC
MEGRYYRKHWPEYEDLGWNYYGCPTAIDTQSNWRKESSSSGPTDSVLERKWRCSSPVKLVSLCLSIILLGLICGIIYLSHLKDQNIRYYTSEGKLTINQAYTSNLKNTNSEEYSLFTYKFCVQMERTFKSNNSPYGSTYQSCDVQSLTPGSIIVTFTLYFLDIVTVTNEEVISVITSSVRVVNSNTVFGDYIVDTSTLSVTTTLQVYEQDPLPEIKSINLPSTSTTSTTSPSTEMVTTSSTKTTEASTTQTTSTASPSTEMVTTSSTKTTEASTTQTTSTASPSTEMVTTSSTKTTEASTTQTTSTASPSTEMVTTSSTKTTEASTTQTTSTASTSTEMVTTSSTKTTEASTRQTTSTASPSTEMVTTSSTKTEVSTTQKTSTTDAPTSTQSTIVQTTASVLTTDKMTANPATTISTTDEPTSMQSTAFQTTSSASTTDKMTSNPLSTITSPTQSLKNETTTAVSKAVENITKISTSEESMSTQLPTVESTQTLSKSSTTIESTTTDLTSKATSTMSNTVQSTLESSTTHKSTSAHLPTVESTVESTSKPLTTVEITTTHLPEVESTSTIPTTTETTPEQSTSSKTTLAPLITVEAISTNSTMVTPTSSGSNSTESTTMESTEQNSTASTKVITTPETLKTVEATSVTPLTVKTASDSLQTVGISTASSTTDIDTSFVSTAPKTTASQTTTIGASTEDSATVISENTSYSLSAVQTTTEILTTATVGSTPKLQSTSQISMSSSTETITTELSSTGNSISPSTDTTVGMKFTSTTETSIMTTPTSDKTTENLTSTQNVSTTESSNTDIHNTTFTSTSSTYGNTTMYDTTSVPVSPTYVDTTIYNTTTTLDSSTYVNTTMDNTTSTPVSTTFLDTTIYNTTTIQDSSTYVNITMYNTNSTTESSFYLNTTIHNATSTSVSPTYENTTIYNITSTSDFTAYENTTIYNTTSTTDSSTYVNPTIYNITSTTESSTFENTTNYNITSSTMLPSTDMSLDYTSLSTTDHTQTTTISYLSTADVSFPSATVLAKVDITLVCTIKVEDDWSIITAGQELDSDISVLAEYFINGTVSEKTVNDLTTVTFTGDNETIIVAFNIHLSSVAVCPSLLRLTCGIKMMDIAESSITNVSVVHITAPVSNVTLDMSPSFYTGERLELTCRTKTDFEYGDVALEVQFPDGSRLQEPAMRSKYSTTRNGDCTVDFEWIFKSEFSFEQNMNGSIIHCVASNRLLNHTVITSRVVILLTSDVSFAQYYVSGKPGDEVSIACKTNIAATSIQNISIYKISNNTNVTITTYSNGMVTNSPGTSGLGNFQNGTLTVVFTSLQCSDEAQYFCTVTYGSTQITSPLFLTLQPTTTAGSTPVSLSLSVDIVEKSFLHLSAHYCSGEIGYPEVNGFLSLTFTNPKTKEAVIYNEKMLLNSTKIIVTTISLNKVILADGLILLIREDVKLSENCSTIQRMKFYLNVSNQWNHGQIKCEIQTEDGPVLASEKEEVYFVIPANACGDFNGTGTVFIDHEKVDHCKTYIQCEKNQPPTGSRCPNIDQCAYIGKNYCEDCNNAVCSENPITTALTTPSFTFPTTAGSTGNKYLECTSVSVFLKESAHISCNLNISNLLSLNISKSNSSILSVQSGGTVIVSSSYSGRLSAVFSLSSLTLDITFQTTSCEDDGIYSVMMQFDRVESYLTTFTVTLKVKPGIPQLTLHPNLIDGENLMSHVCTGDVGHPPGKLEIQIKRPGDTDFSIYQSAGQTRMNSEVAGNCSSTQTLDFSIDLSSDSWRNVTIRCLALNSVALNSTGKPPSSREYTLSSIPGNYCTNKTSDYYEEHPMGCPYFVRCVNGRPYGQKCPGQNLCFDVEKKSCLTN